MKEIQLTRGKSAIVDDEDYEYLNQWKWQAKLDVGTGKFYACRTDRRNGKPKCVRMHRVIMETPDGMDTDHINSDTLCNLRENLRIVTRSQNNMNRKFQKNSKTKVKGVTERYGRFYAQIQKDSVIFHIGSYKSLEEAAKAYDRKARDLFGEFAKTNF